MTLPLALLALAGCGQSTPSSPPLGRPITAQPPPAGGSPAPRGDPPTESDGTIPARQLVQQDRPIPGALTNSPQAALRRYALLYTNWQAASLHAQERELGELALGPARLAAEQTTASQSATTALAADHVQNTGTVLAITRGQGHAHSQWIIVTDEHTIGTGPYAGLPPSMHVTLARVQRHGQGWLVSEWAPQT